MSRRSSPAGWAGWRRLAALAIAAAGLGIAAHGAWIPAKAWLAQRLIEQAWSQGRQSGAAPRPWPWADTAPVARLAFPRLRRSLVVLAGDSGAVLAFGPGHRSASAQPGEGGNAVISGHRDTHFALLAELRPGDAVLVERRGQARYTVQQARVIDARDPAAVAAVLADQGDDRLSLVTCWPFGALNPGTPWRYVVTALREPESASNAVASGASVPAQRALRGAG